MTNDATLYFLGCHAVAVVGSPAAVASSDQLSSGADSLGAGIFPASFYLDLLLTHPAAGGITVERGFPANQREGTNNHV